MGGSQSGGSSPPLLQGLVKNKQQGLPPKYDHMMAALRHFREVNRAIEPLLKDDQLGNSNIRPKIFDAVAGLISDGVMTLPAVMNGIKTLPDDPAGQKVWLTKLYKMNQIAEDKVMDDYMASGPNVEQDIQQSTYDPDENHQQNMQGLMSRYQQK